MESIRYLTLAEVLSIHQDQITRHGGEYGIRDLGLLSSAVFVPQSSFEGRYLHRDLFEMAAAYAFHICQNHAFLDGNKRVGLVAALVFLDLNGIELQDPDQRLYELMMEVAQSSAGKPELAALFRDLSSDA